VTVHEANPAFVVPSVDGIVRGGEAIEPTGEAMWKGDGEAAQFRGGASRAVCGRGGR
jgi:hypothetical protein